MNTKALRQKILDLAIRGKLVPQDPNDEPAEVLLERIRKQKQQMLKEGKLKKKDIKNDTIIFKGEDNLHYEKFQDGTVKCIEDEIPFEVPEGWAWSRLNSIVDVRDGTHDTPTYVDKGIPLITSKNLVEGGIDYSNVKYISEKDAISINERSGVNIGDILFAMIGTIGNPSMVTEDILISIKNVALFKFTFSKNLSNHFVMYFLDYAQEDMKNKPSGGLQPFVSLNFLRTYLVPVPPVEEQQRIVSILADSINKIRNIDVLKNELTASVEKAKSKILDLAIRGKLVPQDPNDEPASVLLERIRTEKEELIKQGKIKRDKKESVIFKGEDNSYYEKIGDKVSEYMGEDLPLGWSIASFSQVNMFSAETIDPSHFPEKMFELYSVPNFELGVPEIIKGQEIGSSKQSICENDVLVCKINPRINRVWITRHITSYPILGSSEWVVFRNDYLYAPYMQFYFLAPYFRELLLSNVSGVGGSLMRAQPESVKKYPIWVPPYKEQVRIAEKITELFIKFDDIEKSLS